MRAGKIPESIGMKGGYYDRLNVELADENKEEEKDAKGKKKDAKKKDDAKGKKGKKGKEEKEKKNPLDEVKKTEAV
jgi:hypothetical protein